MSRESIEEELMGNLPGSAVSWREGGGGKMLSYVDGFYVKNRLCEVFGPLGFSVEIVSLAFTCEYEKKTTRSGPANCVNYLARVRLTAVDHCVSKEDVGFGQGIDKDLGKAHESASKEAVTDALKRAATHLGRSMGLALYDKEQRYVDGPPAKGGKKKRAEKPAPERPRGSPGPKDLAPAIAAAKTLVELDGMKGDIRALKDSEIEAFNGLVRQYNQRKSELAEQAKKEEKS